MGILGRKANTATQRNQTPNAVIVILKGRGSHQPRRGHTASSFLIGMMFTRNFIGRYDAKLHIIGLSFNASESDPMTDHLLDAQEAAQILRMDRRTLVRWARIGYVPAHPLGEGKRKLWRFREHELLEWVEARETDRKRPPTSTIEVAINAHARRTA
jgi:excisionase family DNA binding protein